MMTGLAPYRQVAAVILRLSGAAKDLARTLTQTKSLMEEFRRVEFNSTRSSTWSLDYMQDLPHKGEEAFPSYDRSSELWT